MKKLLGPLRSVVFLACVAGCAANPASNRDTIPQDNVTQCRSLCSSAGLMLQSVVIVANQTGCVCGVSSPVAGGGPAAASGGAVAVLLASRRDQQQQRR